MARLEWERYTQGKQLNQNDVKGLLMEKAISRALNIMGVRHKHNPFNNTYPCYQNQRPDIVVQKLDTVIECKNLNKKQVDHLTRAWIDKHVIDRPYNKGYKHKLVLFSFKPRKRLIKHLYTHGWKTYGLGTQILTPREERKAVGKLIRNFYWLEREYSKNKPKEPNEQTRLRFDYLERVMHQQKA
jgi:hypothetical protein